MIYLLVLLDLVIFAALDYVLPVGKNLEVVNGNSNHSYEECNKIRRFKIAVLVVNIIILIVISGFRYFSGFDYESYAYMFQKMMGHQTVSVERGYYYLNVLVYKFTTQVQVVFLVMAIMILSIKGIAIFKGTKRRNFAFFICFALYFLIGDMGQIRSTFAQSLDLLALVLFMNNYKKTALIPILIGTTFHISSVVMLFVYIVWDRKYSTKIFVIIYIALAIFGQFLDMNVLGEIGKSMGGMIGDKLYGYTVNKSTAKIGLSFNVLFDFMMMVFILFMRKVYNLGKDKKFNLLFNVYFLGVCSYLLFNNYFVIGVRFANYFRLALIFLIPLLLDKIENKKIRVALAFIFIFIFSVMVLRQLGSHLDVYLPYRMNLFGKIVTI